MTRISENQLARSVLSDIITNRESYAKYSEEVSSGLKVTDPGDSKFASTISQYKEMLSRISGHETRLDAVEAQLSNQDNIMSQVSELLVKAKEIASQASSETVGTEVRKQLSGDVFEILDGLVNLANSKYQGKYIYGGGVDGTGDSTNSPYVKTTFTTPSDGSDSTVRWVYTSSAGADLTKTVKITDDTDITVSTPGSKLFNDAIYALERLGRSLAGYSTDLDPATGAPIGTGTAYNLPDDMDTQTADINSALDALEAARQNDIMPERVSLGARMKRVDTAQSMLDLTKSDAQQVLKNLQSADYTESATNLSQAETALQASYLVNSMILKMTILDYL